MFTYKNLMTVGCAAVLAIGLAACGSSSDDDDTAMDTTTPTTPAQPVAVSGDVTLPMAAQAAFGILMNPGDSDAVEIAAGGTAVRQGVTFSCDSAYPCTVTVTNNLGTIVASWMSYTLDDGAAGVMASVPRVPVDTFANLNMGSIPALRALVTAAPPTLTPTELTGMGLGDGGVLNADNAGLRSSFDPNSPLAGGPAGAPGAANGLTGGSTLTGMTDEIPASADMDAPPSGWVMKTLFRDWGDTAGTGDGGFETGAIVVKNLGTGTPQPFDAMLANRFANLAAQGSYAFGARFDGMGGAAMDSVVITLAMGPATVQSGAMQLTVGAPQLETLADTVPAASEHRGSYFGAAGTYMCNVGPCAIRRATGGSTPFGVDTSVLAPGTWWFRPDPGATITVPDQDWMVYGAWMTTPDVAAGTHRIGVLANGFDPYEGAAGVFAAGGLTGTATYSGGAAGVYVNDSTASGLFTANATLTANFDVNGNGAVDAAANDYTIAGRIDDFRGTDGNFLGTDTAANPNDPVTGGENDWVVLLSQVGLAGVIPTTPTAGSADGVTWAGNWSGQLYGPNVDAMGNAVSPSGVAGQFNAATANNATAVVGAFGATRD